MDPPCNDPSDHRKRQQNRRNKADDAHQIDHQEQPHGDARRAQDSIMATHRHLLYDYRYGIYR
jgi:hypothetical protein